jgi:hypothetical protein
MRRVFGPRTVVEAAFLVAVPVGSLMAGLGPYAIVGASAVGYLLVLLVEAVLWRGQRSLPELPPLTVDRPRVQAEPAVAPQAEPEPPAEEEPAAEPEPEPEPVAAEPEPEPVVVRVLQSVPDQELEPKPEPEPESESQPEPEAEPEPVVVPIGVGASPRTWNLWDLERLTRGSAGADAVRDEERTFLLMYLREFAGADGVLPVDFDGLVRESFGDLVGVR